MTQLALQIPIENLLIPPSTYLTDRRISNDIFAPYATGKRAFAVTNPFPTCSNGQTRFPRVLRETTSFLLMEPNVTSEGIFRIPPNSKLRDVLKEAYDRGQKYIIWKDNEVTLPVPSYLGAEHQDEILAEVDPKDAYSVFMAAALIKAWYASLREPIFPTDSYRDLKRLYGDAQDVPDLDRLRDLFSPTSEWSLLSGRSREIVVRHLLPLLSIVAARQDQNKMTAENLAVCFAPALLCGPDQLEDAKMSSIIRRIFTHAIDMWSQGGLREACGQTAEHFIEELKLPKDEYDWDDPVEGKRRSAEIKESMEEQSRGITLQDNEKLPAYTEPQSDEEVAPPLPPRSRVPSTKSSADSTKRKPAPPLVVPPRYSSIISDAPEDVAESPITYAATTDGFAPRRNDDEEQLPPLPPRWNAVTDEKKKSGTSNPVPISASARYHAQDDPPCPVATFASKLNITKRKTLTSAQIDNVDKSVVAQNESSPSSSEIEGLGPGRVVQLGFALPGLTTTKHSSNTRAKRTPSIPQSLVEEPTTTTTSPVAMTNAVSPPPYDHQFRRPSIPASASRTPSITSLARPVYPPTPLTTLISPSSTSLPLSSRPSSKSSSLNTPTSATRLRAPSPSLLQRMPSFEKPAGQNEETCPVRKMFSPKKLNLKKQSVEDLRRLYEERAGTARELVEAGRFRYA